MRTRNSETPKSATTAKKTPPSKKTAVKSTPPNPTESAPESATPNSTETKHAPITKGKQVKTNETTPNPSTDSEPQSQTEAAKGSDASVEVTPETKTGSGTRTVRKVVKKRVLRVKTPTSSKAISRPSPESGGAGKKKVGDSTEKEEVENGKDAQSMKKGEPMVVGVEESVKKEDPVVDNIKKSVTDDHNLENDEEVAKEEESASEAVQHLINVESSHKVEDGAVTIFVPSSQSQGPSGPSNAVEQEKVKEEMGEEMETVEDREQPKNEPPVDIEEDINNELKGKHAPLEEDVTCGDEKIEKYSDQCEEFGGEELVENDADNGDEAEALEEERAELTAAAKERKIRKELEIFVGGLDRDAVEEDVKKAFENVGEVVEVRLHKNPSTSKNKGYAFVKFATKEQVARALSEMKNPVICGKRCGTSASEDNDTLFLGNICNTWTKEAIKQKLKDYGIEGVENITLVLDAQREGLSRGFAFIEFSCHADAMLAYKRLQKPDVIFGHPERTAKVAFAEPLREPDPEIMAHVKSVFVDGLPPHWDEDRVRERFKSYGEIERIMLARNMSTAKRKDFGFVDFTTHEAAIASIDGINNTELVEGNSKTKVRARLSNPLPKTQAVKGGMCGGFRIGHGGSQTFSKFGRGFGRGGHPFSRPNFQHGRGSYQRGHGQAGRMGFVNEQDLDPYPPFHGRQNFGRGGRWGSFGGPYQASGGGSMPARNNIERSWPDAPDRSHGKQVPSRRQPFFAEEFNRPFVGRHFDDPYLYDDTPHGPKRPFFMTEQDPDYMEPSRFRRRLDYSDPEVSLRGPSYRDTYEAGAGLYSHDYYDSDYRGGAYSSFYGGDLPYGRGYYY